MKEFTDPLLVDIALNPLQSSLDVSINKIWVVGRSSATTRLLNQLNPIVTTLSFCNANTIASVVDRLSVTSAGQQQMVIACTAGLTYTELIALYQFSRSTPNVPIAICFSSAQLDLISYAWPLGFAAYLTADDSSADCALLTRQLVEQPQSQPLLSPVFRKWLRSYGILFENDKSPL